MDIIYAQPYDLFPTCGIRQRISDIDINLTYYARTTKVGFYGQDTLTSFVEGISDNIPITITLNFDNISLDYNVTGSYTINEINLSNLNTITYNNHNYIPINNRIKGYITGNVDTSSCKTSNFYIECYNDDLGYYVGSYEIVNNRYEIPNLDATMKYNIHMIDRNLIKETLIHSHRSPTPYGVTI